MNNISVSFSKNHISSVLSSRKMTLEQLRGIAEINDDLIVFPSFQAVTDFSNHISVPVDMFYQEAHDNDLDEGVKIARRDETFSRDEIRDGVHYYTYHHLVTTKGWLYVSIYTATRASLFVLTQGIKPGKLSM